jgi:hypothetical protein
MKDHCREARVGWKGDYKSFQIAAELGWGGWTVALNKILLA